MQPEKMFQHVCTGMAAMSLAVIAKQLCKGNKTMQEPIRGYNTGADHLGKSPIKAAIGITDLGNALAVSLRCPAILELCKKSSSQFLRHP